MKFFTFLWMCPLIVACSGKKNDTKQSIPEESLYLFVGTYTSPGESRGIYVYRFDEATGTADSVTMAEISNPSFLTLNADLTRIYAVSENGTDDSYVHALSFDSTEGRLTLLNSQKAGGSSPCYIELDPMGQRVVTANYGGGSISVFPTHTDGSLRPLTQLLSFKGEGRDPERQKQPHLHSVRFSPDGRYLFASDLGTDHLYRYEITPDSIPFDKNSVKVIQTLPGTGPRHFDFHPNGQYLYLLGELSGQVVVYHDHKGAMEVKQGIVADSMGARGSAHIKISPDGQFLYASNRLQGDGIAIFSVSPTDGTLTKAGYQPTGKHPRHFALTPDGRYLLVACRDEHKIQVFRRNPENGLLTDTRQDILVHRPVCLRFGVR